MWAAALLTVGLAAAGNGPQQAKLVSGVALGSTPKQVKKKLTKLGATDVETYRFNTPGAFAEGLLDTPSMMALLNRAGAKPPFFDTLPDKGPTFVTARIDGALVSYAFHQGKLWSIALKVPYRSVKPEAGPFDPNRLAPLNDTVSAICSNVRVAGIDDYRNPVAWRSTSCSSGKAMIWYEPSDPGSAVKAVVYRR